MKCELVWEWRIMMCECKNEDESDEWLFQNTKEEEHIVICHLRHFLLDSKESKANMKGSWFGRNTFF